MSLLPSLGSPRAPQASPSTRHSFDDDNNDDDDNEVQLPGLAALPGLIHQAVQRQADKYKGKKPHEIMSATQWRAANTHNEGIKANKRKPPKGLVTTDGAHFFSSIRVLNFYERTKNNLIKQQAEVLNRSHQFNERDMNTFQSIWEEKALLDGDIDKLRDQVILRSRKLDCACNLNRHVNHLRGKRNRRKLIRRLCECDRLVVNAFEKTLQIQQQEESNDDAVTDTSTKPKGLLDLPRVETMYELRARRDPPPLLCSFISTDVILVDTKVIQYLVRIFQEAVDIVNEVAELRELKAQREEEKRKKKREEMLALARAAEEAAGLSEEDEEEEDEEELGEGATTPGYWYTGEEKNAAEDAENAEDAEDAEEETNKDDKDNTERNNDEAESSDPDETYAFSEHSSDFEDEFEDNTLSMQQQQQLTINGPGLEDEEDEYVKRMMEGAIVRYGRQLTPPTWLKFISETLEMTTFEARSRGARFVDLTGSTGATANLSALWSLGWSSFVTYEKNYEDLIIARYVAD